MWMRDRGKVACALVGAAALSGSASVSLADVCGPGADPNQVLLAISANNGQNTGTFEVTQGMGQCDSEPGVGEFWFWSFFSQTDPIVLSGGGQDIGHVTGLAASIMADPVVSVVYGVQAGVLPTSFNISSSASFAAMTNPTGVAIASNTLTDTVGNGGTLTGGFGGKSFRASYNGTFVFHDSEENLSVGAFGSTQSTDPDFSGVITGSVTSATATFDFALSARDISGGTGVFQVVPEPATLGLLGLAGLMMLRRRTR